MFNRGFSINACPVHNLFEATLFIAWTIAAAYLVIGIFPRLRFLGVFASHVLIFHGGFCADACAGPAAHGSRRTFPARLSACMPR